MSNKSIRAQVEKEFADRKHRKGQDEVEVSPSGRHTLLIRRYETKKGCWDYSRGTVYKTSSGAEVCDIKRNYLTFHHSFVQREGEEWLITGRSYMSQTMVNLDTGEEFEPSDDHYYGAAFCWADCVLSMDEKTLVVDGCHWAAPYEYRFFDFTDPSEGWPELDIEPAQRIESTGECGPEWMEDGTVVCYKSDEYYLPLGKFDADISWEEAEEIGDPYDDPDNWVYVPQIKVTLRRQFNKMIVVSTWLSDRMTKRLEDARAWKGK